MMRRSILTAAAVALMVGSSFVPSTGAKDRGAGFDEQDVFEQSYTLAPGTLVKINDISGPVSIQTVAGNVAHVRVERSARTREDLEHRRVVVEQTGTQLHIHTEREKMNWRNGPNVRQAVTLQLPSNVDLGINDIAGSVDVGEIEGTLRINDVAGSVKLAGVGRAPHINDIAGALSVTIARLDSDGLRINDIAGSVEVRFLEMADADLRVHDISGRVTLDVPNATILRKDEDEESIEARIGAGGAPITITDIAGSVKIRTN